MKSFINHSDPHQSASWFLRFERVSDVFGCLGASENIPIDNVKPSYKWMWCVRDDDGDCDDASTNAEDDDNATDGLWLGL